MDDKNTKKRRIIPVDFSKDYYLLEQVKALNKLKGLYGANTKAIKIALQFFIEHHEEIKKKWNGLGEYGKDYIIKNYGDDKDGV